jgi:hypothetical protein
MSAWSILLRVLLCLSLVLNGAGAAAGAIHAATPAQSENARQGTVLASMADDGMPCHGHHGAGRHGSSAGLAKHGSGPAATDCCKSATCHCACGQAAPVMAPMASVNFVHPRRGYDARPYASGHLTPDLQHLIRPPIG